MTTPVTDGQPIMDQAELDAYNAPFAKTPHGLDIIPRKRFAEKHFYYKPGQHLVAGGPTTKGKSTLMFDLLEYTATPELPAYVAVSKPNDSTTAKYGKKLNFRTVNEWPTTKKLNELFNGPPPGYLVWPKFGNMDKDVAECARITRALIQDRYAAGARGKGKGILIMDDTMVKSKVMKLDDDMVTILAMSGAMGLGLWAAVQKPTDSGRTSLWSYNASDHVFLTHDPVSDNQKRYGEIGGVDPKLIVGVTKDLKPFQFLYINRPEGWICVVDKD
jgi:hypothetical protein